MERCVVRSSVNEETLALFGVEPDVIYSASDDLHEKDGILMVYLITQNSTKIEVPISLVAFLPTFHKDKKPSP
jgi:hypothetical protein